MLLPKLTFAAMAVIVCAASSAAPGDIWRVSKSSSGEQGNNNSESRPAISSDGQFTAFSSQASNFYVSDTNLAADVFLNNRVDGATDLIATYTGVGSAPVITPNGRYVAFQSQARIVAADTNNVMDVYSLDRESGTYTLVSRSTSGVVGNAGSFNPSITADGRYVAFTSDATNFVADDINGSTDVFLFDRDSAVTKRISSSTGGTSADGPSGTAVVSADGAYVAYSSQAANLVAGDSNLKFDIFLYQRSNGTTRRVSVGANGAQSNGDSYYPAISADGQLVTFQSSATTLMPDEVGYRSDVFLFNQAGSKIERVSISTSRAQGNNDSERPAISLDGRFVAFASKATNLAPGDSGLAWDIYIRDRLAETTELVSTNPSGAAGNSESVLPTLSAYGRFVAFSSKASDLVAGDTNNRSDIFVRERAVPSPLAGFTVTPTVVAGCKNVSVTILLKEVAPLAGITVRLDDDLAAVQSPATVFLPGGVIKKSFSIKTSSVASLQSGSIRASVGDVTMQAPVSVRPMGLLSLTVAPTTVVGSQPAVGTAKLECSAGPGPVVVDLSSNNPAAAAPVATSIAVSQGLASATFDVTTNPVQSKSYATISGTANGITKSKKLTVNVAAAVSPTSLKFGSVAVGATSAIQTVTLNNKGVVPFSVDSIGLTGTSASWFVLQSNTCPGNLPAGASCAIGVQFKPISAASKSAKLTIATGATSMPLSVSLSGTGI